MTGGTELAARQREVWDRIAPFWAAHRDAAPTPRIQWTPPLPELQLRDARVLEIGCGDGRHAVEMAAAGADVLATDASPVFVELARARADEHLQPTRNRFSAAVVDATDVESLAELNGTFDLIVADMVLMNLVDLRPLADAVSRLLDPRGRFVPTVLHPCFPSPFFVDVDSSGRPEGLVSRIIGVGQRVSAYLPARLVAAASIAVRPLLARPRPYIPETTRRVAVPGQPEPHFNVHRPLGTLLQPFFDAGLVLHGLSEGTGEDRLEPNLLSLELRLGDQVSSGGPLRGLTSR